jgi:sugar lactone lactonase YvrE
MKGPQVFDPKVERVFPCDTAVGESPLWDAQTARLYWVDIPAGRVFCGDPATGIHATRSASAPVGSLALCRDARLLVAAGSELQSWDWRTEQGGREDIAHIPQQSASKQFNDGKAGPDARFWAGVLDTAPVRKQVGAIYGFGPIGAPLMLMDNMLVPNGIAWSPAGDRMIFSDSGQGKVWSLPFDPQIGPLGAPQPWLDWRRQDMGAPDGAAMDVDGCYWSCGIFSGAIHRFDPAGMHIESYRLPISQPTMCCFGGPDLKTLFVTNMTVRLELAQRASQPLAGSVIAFRVGTPGAPVGVFG